MPDENAADRTAERAPDRAVRAVADSIDLSRVRTADDAADPSIPVAATVMVLRDSADMRDGSDRRDDSDTRDGLRDGARGPEVLLIERPDRGSFAGAWVFPGGKVEASDRRTPDEDEETVARRAGVRETREETGLDLDETELVTVSVWDPPPGIALRIRTWFFAVRAPRGDVALAEAEAVAASWTRPADMLARHGRGEVTLYPPTWVTLHALSTHPDAGSVLAAARLAGVERFETVARRGAEGPLLLWEGDAEYRTDPDSGSAAAEASGPRHRLEIGALPWRYTRDA